MRQAPPRAAGTEGGCTFHFDGVSFFGVVQYSLASSEPAPSAKYLKGECAVTAPLSGIRAPMSRIILL